MDSNAKTMGAPGIWTEDLAWQAVRAQELGQRYCTCSDHYHVVWAALRAAGFLGSLRQEEDTLFDVLSPLLGDGARVLIGGSADAATLCAVKRMAGSRQPQIAVADKCQAPLKLIEEFCALRAETSVTIHADLFDIAQFGQWDAIVLNYTHSFIDPEARVRFFSSLASALVPGGTLVCLAKQGKKVAIDDIAKLQAAWFDGAKNALLTAPIGVRWNEKELDEILGLYATSRTIRRVNIPDTDQMRRELHEAGLTAAEAATTPRKWSITGAEEPVRDVETSFIIRAKRDR